MNDTALLEKIWQEKRGKIVSSDMPDLGVSITIDAVNFNWHHIIYGILNLLRSNPSRAFEWSRSWGRTVVQVHPRRGLDFRFSSLRSSDEQVGVFVATHDHVDSASYIYEPWNYGRFTLLLNKSQPVTIEGALLQVERMVDELVWCHSWNTLSRERHLVNVVAYEQALDDVWNNGVSIEYVDQGEILLLKRSNPDLPVRIYGNVLGSGKVPAVIGATLIPDVVYKQVDENISDVRTSALAELLEHRKSCRVMPTKYVSGDPDNRVVCCAATIGKKLHAGHLFQLAFASMVGRAVDASGPIILESNDVGERVIGLIAALSEKLGLPVETTIDLMRQRNEIVSVDLIDECYRERIMKGQLYQEVANHMKRSNCADVLAFVIEQSLNVLSQCGVNNVISVQDSSCTQHVGTFSDLNQSSLSEYGFQFVRYQENGKENICLLEKDAIFTAQVMRASFMKHVQSLRKPNPQVIFVDAGKDVEEANALFRLATNHSFETLEGVGLGFKMEIVSGSNGKGVSIVHFYSACQEQLALCNGGVEVDKEIFSNVLTYFLLTRCMTARSSKRSAKSKVHKIDHAFYDYSNAESMVVDFVSAFVEMRSFLRRVQKARGALFGSVQSVGERNKRVKGFVHHVQTIGEVSDLLRILPVPKVIQASCVYNQVRNWLTQNSSVTIKEIDQVLIGVAMKNCEDEQSFVRAIHTSDITRGREIPLQVLKCPKATFNLNFVDNIRSRGYSEEEVSRLAIKYLEGQFCILKKRNIFFDTLKLFIELSESLTSLNQSEVLQVDKAIGLCLTRLGFSTHV